MMSLSTGMRLGPYEIVSPIGAGGMGEVWKARDTRLNRTVALKVSKVEFSERFEREARAVAALNHPHICTLHDVGPNYLVMELVEGEPLKGPLPLERAVEYAAQILDALDAAHNKGVIHRDLKPANILLTKQGIKLLDFGLARQTGALKETDATLTDALTAKGQILGTLQYMAPEQLQGQEADARSDLFAFGCVLYEMLTGKRAFDGGSAASVIAAILEREPGPLQVAPPLSRVIRKCLAKDPDERFQTARDLKTNLLWATEPLPASAALASKRLWWIVPTVAIAAALGGWAIGHRLVHESQPESRLMRFTIPPPENTSYREGKVSPDGRWLAFIGVESSGKKQIWVRGIDSLTAQPLAPAESPPFWSPDSRFLAFGGDGKLQKIGISGGSAQTICDAALIISGSWNRDQTIIFSGSMGGGPEIFQVPEKGGEAKRLTKLDSSRKENQHVFPAFLPDARHFVYTIQSAKKENGGIYVGSLDSPDARIRLLADISSAEYAPASPGDSDSGYLLFARGAVLMAQRFGARDLQMKGEAFPIVEIPAGSASSPSATISVSQNGVLLTSSAYFGDQLTWFDRTGNRLGTLGNPGLHFYPQLSPDEQTVVVDEADRETFSGHIWLIPVGRGTPSLFTFIPSRRPIWSPDGSRIAFEAASSAFYTKTSAGTEEEVLLLESANLPEGQRLPCDWSKDGRFLIYSQRDPKTGFDLWMLPLLGNRKPVSFLHTEFNEKCGGLSPDGRWIAYSSDELGRSEIYVQAFSQGGASGRKWQVSYNGGTWPKWRRDGKELFYLGADRNIVAMDVTTGATFQSGTSQVLFASGITTPDARFDVTADGRRFVIPTAEGTSAPATVVMNWTKGIKP